VLLRPVPVDEGDRYADVRRSYPELIYARPNWVHTVPGDWSRVIPLPEDVAFLANLTHHADLNINVASTMTLDFAIHDKPVVNIAFDVASPPPFGMPLWDYYYQFEHYRPVVELGAARFARSPDELADHVNAYLENPALDRENRRRLVELEVSLPLGRSSQRIVEVLESIAG
jgi:CDP-glycerol glycerophosphotransferase (TagB/SpsB family)